jgi:hypothetical protein
LRIFEENQNPVDMHTSIMCINIPQNIKAVAPKLQPDKPCNFDFLQIFSKNDR